MGSLVYTYRRFSKSVPLKRMASSKNIFVWFCGVLICQWGLPRRTKPCGVSDPAEQSLAGVSDPAEQWQSCVHFITYTCSAGSDTPLNKVLRGIRPRGTKSCGVSNPAEQHSKMNFFFFFCEFEKELKRF